MDPVVEPVKAAYGAGSLDQIVPTLLQGRTPRVAARAGRRGRPPWSCSLLDGLGWNQLEQHRADCPSSSAMTGGPITTVIPSTTAAALTSLATGMAPAQHGIVGFRMRVDDAVLNVLRWQVPYGRRAPDPFSVQRHTAFLGRPVPVVTKKEFRKTGFTEAHLRGSRFFGWSTTSVLVEHCRRLVGHDERFVYAYYPGVDTVAHEFGLHDDYYRRRARVRGRAGRSAARRAAVARDARRHRRSRAGARRRQLDPAAPAARDVQVLRGGGTLPVPLREQGRGGRAARSGARRVRRPGLGVLARPAPRRGLARPGAGHRVDPAPDRRRDPGAARARWPSSIRTCRTRPTWSGAHGSLTADEMFVPLLAARGRASGDIRTLRSPLVRAGAPRLP